MTDDGTETDLDLGHYERFAGVRCDRHSNYTSGKIYSSVIAREREGGYLGATVQMIPHITDEIKRAIRSAAKPGIDIVMTEIGGTAGDIESLPFLEAVRQFKNEAGIGKSLQSCPLHKGHKTLYDPVDYAHLASLSMGFSRQE